MNHYGGKEIAASFRTVRNNTIQIAEDIPEEKYDFRAAPETRTVAQTLFHISNVPRFGLMLHRDSKLKSLVGFDFMGMMGPILAEEQKPHTKAEILQRLREGRDEFASFVETLTDDYLAEVVTMPEGGTPPSRSRFDMLIAAKEHEMHHRGQLMLIQRMLGIVPHLTRAQQERMAAMQAAAAKKTQA
jgi:uncharacterized damage-inducible protein DinB